VTKRLDPAREDAGVRLRTLRLRRGMSQVALADLACISPTFVSIGREDAPAPGRPGPTMVPFPARCDPVTLARHQQLARQFIQLAPADTRAAGDWLRRLAREPAVSPWLLLDQLAAPHTARPAGTAGQDDPPCHSLPTFIETP
jgi:transcriptional regulator with XRE-family HTH domain